MVKIYTFIIIFGTQCQNQLLHSLSIFVYVGVKSVQPPELKRKRAGECCFGSGIP